MGVWSRIFRGKRTASRGAAEENLLVISDIHLGEDIVIEGPEHLGGYIRALNRELAAFVAAHRNNPIDNRRWHLVVNGDMFDFVKVSLRPEPEEAFRLWAQEPVGKRRPKTIPNTAKNVVWKLERIIEIHRPLFKEMALFLLDGHRLTFIEGNHDAEFYFSEVRESLRTTLVRMALQQHHKQKRSGTVDAEELAGQISYSRWFEARPGRYHIEHGHQYDEFCSFEWQLAPFNGKDNKTLATPLSHRAAPYFAEYSAEFTAKGLDKTNLRYWLRWSLSLGPKGLWRIFVCYWAMVFDLIGQAGPRRQHERLVLGGNHQQELHAMESSTPYGLSTLEHLDALKALPAEYSRFKMYHGSYVDRFLISGSMILALLPAPFLGWEMALLWVLGVLGLGLGAFWITGHLGRVDVPGSLRLAASKIAEITGARYVIFGHSHQPEVVDLSEMFGVGQYGEKAHYLNTGSWITREVLLGEKGGGMTYVEITRSGATLKRWRGVELEAELLDSTSGTLTTTPEVRVPTLAVKVTSPTPSSDTVASTTEEVVATGEKP